MNSSKHQPIIIERTYKAPVEKLWSALTDVNEMRKWYFDVSDFKPVPGFEFSFYGGSPAGKQFLHLCKVTDAIPDKIIRYSWKYDNYDGISFVSFELFPEGNNSRLRLTHEGLETFPADKPDFDKKNFEMGWSEITGTSLKKYLEGEA